MRKSLARFLLAIALTTSLGVSVGQAQPLIFGVDPDLAWQTLETPHFRIHFHEGLKGVAHQAAAIAEEAYAFLEEEMGEGPPMIDLVIADPVDFPGGFTNPLSNQIVIFASQQRLSRESNVRPDSWWHRVITHELVHAFDLNRTEGISTIVRRLFGRIALPSVVKPMPFVEGLAVYQEHKHLGESRMNDTRTRMMLRRMVLENEIPRFDDVKGVYNRDAWPPLGALWYNYGSWLARYVEEAFGKGAWRRLNSANAGHPLNLLWPLGLGANFDDVTEEALGVTADQLYTGFERWLREQFAGEIESIRERRLTVGNRITTWGFSTDGPVWSPGGDWLAYTHQGRARAGLRLITPEGDRDHELIPGTTLSLPAWSPQSDALVYAKLDYTSPYAVRSDLYRYDLDSDREERLTRNERAYFAQYAPDGQQVYYAKMTGHTGATALAVLDLQTGRKRVMKDFSGMGGVIHSFALSPNGDRVALSLWRPGGYQDIYLLPAGGGELTPVTQDRHEDADPEWSPDGDYLVFSSDPGRVANIYAYRLSDGSLFQVTNVMEGAFDPTISPSGDEIAYVGYGASGYDLYRVPFDPKRWKSVRREEAEVPQWTGYPMTDSPVERYNPLPQLVPRFWVPVPLRGGAGVVTAGHDPLLKHIYGLIAGWDIEAGQAVYELSYLNNVSIPLLLSIARDRRSASQRLEAFLPLPLSLSPGRQQLLSVAYERRTESSRSPSTSHGLHGRYRLSQTEQHDLFQHHTRLEVRGSLVNDVTRGDWHRRLLLDWSEVFRLPVETTHRLTWGAAAGWTDAPDEQQQFELGGAQGPFRLGGYEAGFGRGKQAVSTHLSYSFPLFSIRQSWGEWPLLLDQLGGRLFFDAGMAADRLELGGVRAGFGAELHLSVTLGYRTPVTLSGGIAQGIGKESPLFYVRAELSDLF